MIDRAARFSALQTALKERILILDGGMGTMIQSYRLEEADYRGERFADWPSDVKGNNDLLLLMLFRRSKKPIWMQAPISSRPIHSTPRASPKPTTVWKRWCMS